MTANSQSRSVNQRPPSPTAQIPRQVIALASVMLAVCLWVYWPALTVMARVWVTDPQYSHGYLVPAFSLVLLWMRGGYLRLVHDWYCWYGVPVLAAAGFIRYLNSLTYNLDWIDGATFVLAIGGVVTCLGGLDAVRWAWPSVAFLLFMIPLPYRVEQAMAYPLQRIAAKSSAILMQTFGLPAVCEANVIQLHDIQLNIAEACSGLSMLLIFAALATAFAIVIRRPWPDKVVLVASAVPIAVIANIARITVTGVLHCWVNSSVADLVFHDLAGWLMMPFALGLLWLEVRFMSLVLVDPAPIAVAFPGRRGGPANVRSLR
jgi:exosortase